MKSLRLGLHGFGEHPWRSVDRTRRFYLDALAPEFSLICQDEPFKDGSVDAVLSFAGDAAWQSVESARVPYLFAVHGGATLDHAALRGCAGKLRSSDTLIVNCESDETILKKMFQGVRPRFCRLPLPAHATYFERIDRAQAREHLPFDTEPDLLVGFVARLLPQKNFHQFLLMLAQLSVRLAPRRVEAIVIGEYWTDYPVLPYVTREYREYIVALARELGVSDRIVYLGSSLNDSDMRLAYSSMDVLIHPTCSLDENFGYAPVEAMACGVPVVGAAYGGLKDTVLPGETGYLMPTWTTCSGLRMDLIGGAEHAERLLREPQLRARMSASARAHTQARYNHVQCAEQLVNAVRTAVDAHPYAQPLSGMPALTLPESAGYLPPLAVGWEYYWPVVDDYVQGAIPTLTAETRLRLPSPARFEPSLLVLADPAWPARIPLDAEEYRICGECQETRPRSALNVDDAVLSRLLYKGALIASDPSPRASR